MNELALAAYLTLFSADASTTHYAFAQFPGQVHELFMTQNPTVNDAMVAAQATGLLWATKDIKRPWVKWTIRLGVAGMHGYAAAHNLQQIRKVQR